MKITGTFDVTLDPKAIHGEHTSVNELARLTIDKTFHGELAATSQGEMLSSRSAKAGSAGYVALEQVTGELHGRHGSFVLMHYGQMADGEDLLTLEVVPNSGTQDLIGLSGKMDIRIEDGQHFYDFDYELPAL